MKDFHIHLKKGITDYEVMKEYIEKCIKLGIDEVVFLDHGNRTSPNHKPVLNNKKIIKEFLRLIKKAKKEYKNIIIHSGIEVDYFFDKDKRDNEIELTKEGFDYIIGSVHGIKYLGLDNNGYYNAMLDLVKTYPLNVLAHLKLYDDYKNYDNIINEILKLRAEACLDSLPAQLSKDYKKFRYSLVNVKGHSPEKADGLQYLIDLGLVYKSYNVREISSPLEANKVETDFKVFLADTGLLIAMLEQGTRAKVLTGDINAYKGAIAENMIAVTLVSHGYSLYYYRASNGSPELDFIYNNNGEPVIVECKSTNSKTTSMNYVLSHQNKYGKHIGIKIANANVGSSDKFNTYPLYAFYLLLQNSGKEIINTADPNLINTLFE